MFIEITDFESIPDFARKNEKENSSSNIEKNRDSDLSMRTFMRSASNKNYYRQRVTSLVLAEFFRPLRFWLKNQGGIGARDVYIDLNIRSNNEGVIIVAKSQLPTSSPSEFSSYVYISSSESRYPDSPDELIARGFDGWSTQIEIPALQPQRELSPAPEFFIGARESCDVTITAKIFADTLAEPEIQDLTLRIDVDKLVARASEVVSEIILPTTEAGQTHEIALEESASKSLQKTRDKRSIPKQ
jgi:hypothetical protein